MYINKLTGETFNNRKEAKQKLRDEVYNTMVERSKNSNVEYIEYRSK